MTTFYRNADIPAMLADFGVPVTIGAATANGIVDYVDAVTLQQNGITGVIGKTITVMVQTSVFPAVKVGDSLTVDGVPYKVRLREQQTDGAITHLLCVNP